MIRLIFSINRETYYVEIDNKIVTYKDRKLKKAIQILPKNIDAKKQIIYSRNKLPTYLIELIEDANTGKNLEEYNSAQTDEELIPIIKWDCCSKGSKFEKMEKL